jgi:prepilin signal peptidase PulO-like enzyme (type II secretory pathway)
MQRALVLALGWAFGIFGALDLFDDVLQGVLLLALGLYLLSFEQPWVRDRRADLEKRFPDAARLLATGEGKLRALHAKVSGEPPSDPPGAESPRGGPGSGRGQ